MNLDRLQRIAADLSDNVHRVVIGQDEAIELMLTALVADGHVLLEGVPGTAKTLLARSFAASLDLSWNRIQFTPDLMPGDILGTNLFDFQNNRFELTRGPVFTQVLLADEINRTPPKTQAALLQAMQERAVSIDGTHLALERPFLVVATQNPVEQQGTYPLPEAQLDRFLFQVDVDYPTREQEREMVLLHGHRRAGTDLDAFELAPVVRADELRDLGELLASIRVSEEILDYVLDLTRATREHPSLLLGASPRATNLLTIAARARAALQGRDFVIPDDVKTLALPTLRHRLVLAPAAEIEGTTERSVLEAVVDQVAAPR